MTRSDVDLGAFLGRNIGILHRRTMLAGFLFGAELIVSSFQVDFSPDRMFLLGQAAPILDLDDDGFFSGFMMVR
ncbi:hypothetical protein [Sinorhizobium psoraleae]|uniref:Uncharacterized protein n=1 Tax=Sinorhizobium psoraleae TaxID=520838 RepID=A0ABT4KA09_9HYPH|nr:hypothetical protein [Sinorhizobium psoraleae]MCZ4088650.1 hypothetical protein [Sinorhizobium psoraleae]